MIVTVLPLCKRAKDRVTQHGSQMLLKKEGVFNGEQAILVESLNETWRIAPGVPHKWGGWLTASEASWKPKDLNNG